MRLRQCSREKEVLDLLKSGHWPEVCDPDLRAHVKACSSCSDTVLVKSAFQGALAQSRGVTQLDSPSLIWWRAQLLRRNAAVERVSKPVTGANRFALTIYLLAALGLVVSQVRLAGGWTAWISGLGELKIFHPDTLWSVASVMQDWDLSLLIPCVGAIALLSGVVIYLAAEKS